MVKLLILIFVFFLSETPCFAGMPEPTECDATNSKTPMKVSGQHPNGQKAFEGTCLNRTRHGHFIWWNESGGKISEADYVSGKFDGVRTSWYPNGQIRERQEYVDMKMRKSRGWYENGKHWAFGQYDQNGKIEYYISWLPDGAVQQEQGDRNLTGDDLVRGW